MQIGADVHTDRPEPMQIAPPAPAAVPDPVVVVEAPQAQVETVPVPEPPQPAAPVTPGELPKVRRKTCPKCGEPCTGRTCEACRTAGAIQAANKARRSLPEGWLSFSDVARRAGCTDNTVRSHVAAGRLGEVLRLSATCAGVREDAVTAWLAGPHRPTERGGRQPKAATASLPSPPAPAPSVEEPAAPQEPPTVEDTPDPLPAPAPVAVPPLRRCISCGSGHRGESDLCVTCRKWAPASTPSTVGESMPQSLRPALTGVVPSELRAAIAQGIQTPGMRQAGRFVVVEHPVNGTLIARVEAPETRPGLEIELRGREWWALHPDRDAEMVGRVQTAPEGGIAIASTTGASVSFGGGRG
jgi:hypothetical protein